MNKKAKIITITVSVTIAVLLIAFLTVIPIVVFPMFLGQRYEQRQYEAAYFGTEAEFINLTTDDSIRLAAWRTRAGNSKGTIIILSGIQNPSVTAFFGFAKMFSDNGWDSLLIEMRARSKSGGDEIGFGMTEWLDVKAGVDFLRADERARALPIIAMGTSMGAAAVIIAAGEVPEIDAVISLSSPSSINDLFADNMARFGLPKIIGIMDIPFFNIYLGLHFGFSSLKYTPVNGIKKLGKRPILFMQSTDDTEVPFREFEKLFKTALKTGLRTHVFVREGDEHFICYERYFENPALDTEFSQVLLGFLGEVF